jgi:hypothetical protein
VPKRDRGGAFTEGLFYIMKFRRGIVTKATSQGESLEEAVFLAEV